MWYAIYSIAMLHIIIVVIIVVVDTGPMRLNVAIVGDAGTIRGHQLTSAHAGQLAVDLAVAQCSGDQIAMVVVSARGLIDFTATAATIVA